MRLRRSTFPRAACAELIYFKKNSWLASIDSSCQPRRACPCPSRSRPAGTQMLNRAVSYTLSIPSDLVLSSIGAKRGANCFLPFFAIHVKIRKAAAFQAKCCCMVFRKKFEPPDFVFPANRSGRFSFSCIARADVPVPNRRRRREREPYPLLQAV